MTSADWLFKIFWCKILLDFLMTLALSVIYFKIFFCCDFDSCPRLGDPSAT